MLICENWWIRSSCCEPVVWGLTWFLRSIWPTRLEINRTIVDDRKVTSISLNHRRDPILDVLIFIQVPRPLSASWNSLRAFGIFKNVLDTCIISYQGWQMQNIAKSRLPRSKMNSCIHTLPRHCWMSLTLTFRCCQHGWTLYRVTMGMAVIIAARMLRSQEPPFHSSGRSLHRACHHLTCSRFHGPQVILVSSIVVCFECADRCPSYIWAQVIRVSIRLVLPHSHPLGGDIGYSRLENECITYIQSWGSVSKDMISHRRRRSDWLWILMLQGPKARKFYQNHARIQEAV